MPPKEKPNIKLFYRTSDHKWGVFSASDVNLISDEPEPIDTESFLRDIGSFTISLKIISGSNKRRLHGKKPYRMRTHWKWSKRYEIHCRTACR